MRRRLLEALTYPRLFVLEKIDLADCPQKRLFDASCDRCCGCGLKQECHWLRCLNDFADFAGKSAHTMHASLLYSIGLIEAHNEQMQHNSRACTCESCTWTRDARQLTREFSRQFTWTNDTGRRDAGCWSQTP
ncbi:MAG: hypothetical protein ACE5OQ_07970 [Woeseia sp.]